MKFAPRPYQRLIIEHIIRNPRAAVWAGMGLGKTVSTLTAVRSLMEFDTSGPTLVIAPLRVAASTWPQEVAKWDHLSDLKVSAAVGDARTFAERLAAKADIYCTNFERIPQLVEVYGRKWPFKTVVVDEATRLKGFRMRAGTQRAKALGRVAHLYCDNFIELTGTPAPNSLLDLWGQLWFLDRGKRLGASMQAYKERWFRPVRVGMDAHATRWDALPGSLEDISKRISDICLRINTEDFFPVEKPIEARVEVSLPPEAMKLYTEMRDKLYIELESGAEIESPNVTAAIGRCLQIASGAIYTDDGYEVVHREKVDALCSILEEANGEPVLVAYHFRHELAELLKAFPQARVLDKNPATITEWNKGRIPLLLAHPASCGHGLNLQDGGRILVFYSSNWNLEEHQQIVERIGPTRQKQSGHPRSVFIYSIVAKQTIDEAVMIRLVTKCSVQDALLGK